MSPPQAVAVTTLSQLCKQKMARKGRREGDNNRQKAERVREGEREQGKRGVKVSVRKTENDGKRTVIMESDSFLLFWI